MKNYKYIAIIVTFIFAVGCEKEEEPSFPLLQDATWTSSIRPSEPTPFPIKEGQALTFVDLSQGALSHEFIIEEGNKYIRNDYKKGDSLALFVISDLGTTNNSKNADVLFLNPGLNKVKLRNTFKDSVTYQAETPVGAVFENGVWVLEHVWEIDVYGKLKPAFKVLDKDENEVINVGGDDVVNIEDAASWLVIDVESGESLTFVDLTTEDRPTGRQWRFNEGKPQASPSEMVTVEFFKLGAKNVGTLSSIRGDGLPGERTSKIIPLIVNVIPSSQPLEFTGNLEEALDETISFTVRGQLKQFTGQESSFTVNVKNIDKGFDKDVIVKKASVNAQDATKVDLVLSEAIYNTDDVTVSYSGTGITSIDERVLQDFGPETVLMNPGLNLVLEYFSGFENPSKLGNVGNHWKAAFCQGFWVGNKNGTNSAQVYSRSTAFFASGVASMFYNSDNVKASKPVLAGLDFGKSNIPTAGTFRVSMKVFLAEGNNMSVIKTRVTNPWKVITWDISDQTKYPRGEWIELSQNVTFATPPKGKYDILIWAEDNPGTVGPQKLYIDDMAFAAFEERP